MTSIYNWIKNNYLLLVILLLSNIFAETISNFCSYLSSNVLDNSIYVQLSVILIICILYIVNFKKISAERYICPQRLCTLMILGCTYLSFRQSGFLYFYSFFATLNYIDVGWVVVLCFESAFFIYRLYLYCKKNNNNDSIVQPFCFDAPSVCEDKMDREKYVHLLVDKIVESSKQNTSECGAFTILINESFGAGKTTFLHHIEKHLKQLNHKVYWFKPWLYDTKEQMTANLLNTISVAAGGDEHSLSILMKRYSKVIASANNIYVPDILFDSNQTSVEDKFLSICELLRKIDFPIVILIDDVDRLLENELFGLLQLIRNTADFPNVYYIVAADKEKLLHVIGKKVESPDCYLTKFFNTEFYFPADDNMLDNILFDKLLNIHKNFQLDNHTHLLRLFSSISYKNEIFRTLRDVNRYCNLVSFDFDMYRKEGMLNDVYWIDVYRICLIKYIDNELYRILRDNNQLFLEVKRHRFVLSKKFDDFCSVILSNQAITPTSHNDLILYNILNHSGVYKLRIIEPLLRAMFDGNSSELGISHVVEYHKYFSGRYRKNEISNAEIVWLLKGDNVDELFNAVANKYYSVIHKLKWYVLNESYDRLALVKIIFAIYNCRTSNYNIKHGNVYLFSEEYEALIAHIYCTNALNSMPDDNSILQFIYEGNYMDVSYFLLALKKFYNKDFSTYNIRDLNKYIKIAIQRFIEDGLSKNLYNESFYVLVPMYRDLNPILLKYAISNIVCKLNDPKEFFYHIIKLDSDGAPILNDSFINAYFRNVSLFEHNAVIYGYTIPDSWRNDIIYINRLSDLRDVNIDDYKFLREAVDWWNVQN